MIPCFYVGPFTFRLGLAHARPPTFYRIQTPS